MIKKSKVIKFSCLMAAMFGWQFFYQKNHIIGSSIIIIAGFIYCSVRD